MSFAKHPSENPAHQDSYGGHGRHADPKPAPGHSDGDGGSGNLDLAAKLALDTGGDGPQSALGAALASDTSGADLALLGALADGAGAHGDTIGGMDIQAYDGHVALTLDPGFLPGIDSTLDALTSSHHLFDVPVLDVACLDDALPT